MSEIKSDAVKHTSSRRSDLEYQVYRGDWPTPAAWSAKRHSQASAYFRCYGNWELDEILRKVVRHGLSDEAPILLFLDKLETSSLRWRPPRPVFNWNWGAKASESVLVAEDGLYVRIQAEASDYIRTLFHRHITSRDVLPGYYRNSPMQLRVQTEPDDNPSQGDGIDDVGPESESTELKFRRLADEWRNQTLHLSNVQQRIMHPAYQKILGMGSKAVPYILMELRDCPDHWFWALQSIVDAGPVFDDQPVNFWEVRQAWLKWGRSKGLI